MAAELVGTAFIRIRAITSGLGGDIKDGLNKGTADAKKDSERSGRDLGDGIGEGLGDGLEDRLDVEIPGAIRRSSNSKESRKASDESGKSLSRRISDAFHNDGANFGSSIGKSLSGALNSIQLPGGGLGVIALNALPILGGLAQVVVALGATLVAQLGYIATAAGGAGVALLGVGSAVVLGIVPALLAFKAKTPALEQFQTQSKELLSSFLEIGEAAQEGLFSGLLGALTALQDVIPRFKEFGREIGFVIGDIARFAAESLTSDSNLDALGRTMASSVTIIGNLGSAVISIFDFLPKLIAAAAGPAERLSASVASLFSGLNTFITTGAEDGTLTATFDLWYDRLEVIGSILGDLLVGIWNVFSVGADVSAPMFDNLAGMAEKFRDFTSSVDGENKISTFFTNARDISSEVLGIIGDIVVALSGPLTGSPDGIIEVLRTFREEWLPDLISITQTIARDSSPVLIDLVEQIGRFIGILADNPEMSSALFSTLGSSLIILEGALSALNTVLENDIGQKLITTLAPFILVGKVASSLGILTPALQLLGGVLAGLLGAVTLPVALIAAAIALLVGGLVLLYFHFQPFRDLVDKFQQPLKVIGVLFAGMLLGITGLIAAVILLYFHFQPFRDFVDGLIDAIASLSFDDILAIPGKIAGAFTSLPGTIRGLVQSLIGLLQDLPAKIGEIAARMYSAFIGWAVDVGPKIGYYIGLALGTIVRLAIDFGPQLLNAFINTVINILNYIASVAPTIIGTVADIFIALPGFVLSALDGLITVITTVIGSIPTVIFGILSTLGSFLAGLFEGAFPGSIAAIQGFLVNVVNFFIGLPGRLVEALASVGSSIAGVFSTAWSAVQVGAQSLFNSVTSFFGGLPASIVTALVNLASDFAGVFDSAWTTVKTAAQGLFDKVVGFFGDLPGAVGDAITGVVGSLATNLKSAFKKAWNSMIDALPSISFGGQKVAGVTVVPSFDFNVDILKFAMGGIVDYPTFGLIGEAGSEAIIPLTNPVRALQLMSESGLDKLALGAAGLTTNSLTTNSGAALHIEHATFNDPVTADIVAAKVRAAIRLA